MPVRSAPRRSEGEGLVLRGYAEIEVPDVARLQKWVDDRTELQPVEE